MFCAYCGKVAPLTREHIIPASLYRVQKELGDKVIGWNEAAGKVVGSEHQIRDVCEKCNGGQLSELDAYGLKLLTASGFLTKNYTALTADLEFDYHKFARWLLKLSFNSARASGRDKELFESLIPYMLLDKGRPSKSQVAIVAGLAAPIKVSELSGGYEALRELADATGRINPLFIRLAFAGQRNDNFTLRVVMFGPLMFFILLYPPNISAGLASISLKKFIKGTKGLKFLKPESSRLWLDAGSRTWVDYYTPQVEKIAAGGFDHSYK